VRKRVVVKERVRLSKRTITDEETVATDLVRERIEIDADPNVAVRESGPDPGEPAGPEPVG
jgi:stress response protein YsnF